MIITISREYGAGGHSIGQAVAKELGIEFYDRDIIKAAVKESGLEMPEVEKVEEEITRTGIFLRMIAPAAYVDQQIHRAARISDLIGSKNPTEIQKKMQKTDAARHTFYEQFTGKHWGDSRNYTISLDTGMLGFDTCVQLICDAARKGDAFRE